MADNLNTFMCRLSGNLGAPTSWNPQELPRPVKGLLYLCLYLYYLYLYFLPDLSEIKYKEQEYEIF